jgi:hypothetical protein
MTASLVSLSHREEVINLLWSFNNLTPVVWFSDFMSWVNKSSAFETGGVSVVCAKEFTGKRTSRRMLINITALLLYVEGGSEPVLRVGNNSPLIENRDIVPQPRISASAYTLAINAQGADQPEVKSGLEPSVLR